MSYFHLGAEAEEPVWVGIDLSSTPAVFSVKLGDAHYYGTRKFIAEKIKQARKRGVA